MRRHEMLVLVAFLMATPVAAETVTIEARRDATLIEHPEGAQANGSGPAFFVGRTSQSKNSVRRGLLWFDVAAAVPEDALIEEARLTLHMTPSNEAVAELRLRRLQADWGEGASASSGGSGAPSQPGDATWIHAFYDYTPWVHAGGQFIGRASATLEVGSSGAYSWTTNVHMVQDVRLWHAAPQRNFGWILIGDEADPQTAKSFASREDSDPALRPVLDVTYRLRGRNAD